MSEADDTRYDLGNLTAAQAEVIRAALDLYARIGLGQFAAISDHPDVWRRIVDVPGFTVDDVERPMNAFKREFLGFSDGQSHGIHSQAISNSNRIAWDIQQVIRHRLSHDRADAEKFEARDRWTVNYDKPRASSGLPLPTFSRTDDEPTTHEGWPG